MGIVVGARTFDLKLDENRYPGVKIVAKGLTVGEALDFGTFLDGVPIAPIMTAEAIEHRDRAYELFASRVVEWNLESAPGQPLPATPAGMQQLDWRCGRDILHAWVRAVSEVSDPLERPSTAGSPFPEASVPMEPWLESHGTSPEPESS